MPTKKTADQPVQIVRVDRQTTVFPLVGITPLIVHNWSEKAKEEMRSKQTGRAKPKKEFKDPAADFEASKYLLPDGREGVPAIALKSAIVAAARMFDDLTMTELRQAVFVHGEGPDMLVPIKGEAFMREDMVRVGKGTADLRYRACYPEWRLDLLVTYAPNVVSDERMVALIEAAGVGGICEWRPSKSASGQYGMFALDVQ